MDGIIEGIKETLAMRNPILRTDKIRLRTRGEERGDNLLCSHVLSLPFRPSCTCYAGYTCVQPVVHALN